MLGEDADRAVLRLFARMPSGAKKAWPALGQLMAFDEARVRVGPKRLIEYVGLNRPWDDMNGRGHASLTPIGSKPLAQHDEPMALVVHAREEALERAPQREMQARLKEAIPGQLLGQQSLVGGDQVRCVNAEERHALHLAKPNAKLEQHRRCLREADVEVPAAPGKNPRRQRHWNVHAGVCSQWHAR